MKILKIFILSVIFFAMLSTDVYADQVDVYVFHNTAVGLCAACDDLETEIRMNNTVRSVFANAMDSGQLRFVFRNLFHEGETVELFYSLSERAGADADNLEMPVFFTPDNNYFDGRAGMQLLSDHLVLLGMEGLDDEETEEEPVRQIPYMPEGAVIAPNRHDPHNVSVNDSIFLYFYLTWCPFCYELAPFLDDLPEYVILPDGSRSNVRLIGFNWEIPEEGFWIEYYHEYFNIPPERRLVPLLIVGDRDLFLLDEVSTYLIPALEAGEGLRTPLFVERIPERGALPLEIIIPIVIGGVIGFFIGGMIVYLRKKKQTNESGN